MKMADILRNLADKLDGNTQGGTPVTRPSNTAPTGDHFQHDVDDSADSANGDVELDPNSVMVFPLQAKLEILKKSAGINSFYDEETDELQDIKKLTGIKAVMQHETDNDDPLG